MADRLKAPLSTGSPATAIDWAAGTFGFNPSDHRQRQKGVKALQQWLGRRKYKVERDGILGSATLSALEDAYAAELHHDERVKPATANLKIETASDNIATSYTQSTAQRPPSSQADAETIARPPQDEEEEEDLEEKEEGKDLEEKLETTVTARPVALSDSAVDDISHDRLGFRPYVEAVAEFILAEQTRPPLAIAINARWGQGKTSFMNMLERELKRKAPQTTIRVGTTWFNPWKYSKPNQVWAAFVAKVTRCLQDHLTREQSWHFRWDRLRNQLHRHADFPMVLRLAVVLLFSLLIFTLPFTMNLTAFQADFAAKPGILHAFYEATKNLNGWLWALLFFPFALLCVLYGYVTFSNGLGLNLLEYVDKTGFKDKIGTLSQFESEMRQLADAVPPDLKVVVFIDDLDRCRGKVLGEIIEALQLADVSRTCIFVMGMDMQIVASVIESQRAALTASTGGVTHMEHGSGYKFLEKIIQARLALPRHGIAEMKELVTSAMGREQTVSPESGRQASQPANQGETAAPSGPGDFLKTTFDVLAGRRKKKAPPETPSDSRAVVETAEYYGSRHFDNPRRLKRFINSFRLQAYLANAIRPDIVEVDRLARFMVLAEKWPAVLAYMLGNHVGSLALSKTVDEALEAPGTVEMVELPGRSTRSISADINALPKDTRKLLFELLSGRDAHDPPTYEAWRDLAAWCGFFYYPGLKVL